MKKRSFYSILIFSILFFAVIPFVSCSDDDDDDDSSGSSSSPVVLQDANLTDVEFDSSTLTLKAKVPLANGTVIKATCNSNGFTKEAQVDGGVISWNLEPAFTASVRAGKEYKVTFSAPGYKFKQESIWYFTDIKYDINCAEEILIFTDAIDSFTLPVIKPLNYDAADVEIDTTLRSQGANLTLEQFKMLVKEELQNPPADESQFSDGLNATYYYTIKPKNVKDLVLKAKLTVEKEIYITFKYQVLVRSVRATHYDDTLEAICFAEETPLEEDIDNAGGKLTYQWQSSTTGNVNEGNIEEGWTNISGATAKLYNITQDSFGKYFRVKIVQTWSNGSSGSQELEPVYSAPTSKITNYVNTSFTMLDYDGVVLKGESPDSTKITGTIIDVWGQELQPSEFTIEAKNTDGLASSGECVFTLSKEGYEDCEVSVFVTVQNVITESELPGFSNDTASISAGHIKFNLLDLDLEYSLLANGNWKTLETGEIPAQEGLVFYFRKAAKGTPKTAGYLKESSALTMTVAKSNLGTKLKTLVISDVKLDLTKLTLSAKTSLANGTAVKVTSSSNDHSEEAQVENGTISWNLERAFPENVLAGKKYKVTFTSDGYYAKEDYVWYFANIKYKINCENEIIVFTDAIDSFELPEIKLLNYAESDVTIDEGIRAQGGNPTLAAFKELVKEELKDKPSESDLNGGLSAIYRYTIIPKNISDTELESKLLVTNDVYIIFKYQKAVNSVKAARYEDRFEALCFDKKSAPESDVETAGGKLSYQWQSSTTGTVNIGNIEEGWTNIEGATSKVYGITQNGFGKYFRVKVVQTWDYGSASSHDRDPVYSAPTAKVTNYVNTSLTTLDYDGVVLKGDKLDPSKISGTIIDVYGEKFPASDFTIKAKSTGAISASGEYAFTISKDTYEDAEVSLFVTVQNKFTADDLPGFSKDTGSISAGCIKFANLAQDLEYSLYNNGKWKTLETEEIPAQEGLVFYFRKAAQGTPKTAGYIKESEALSMTVAKSNLGTKLKNIVLSDVSFDLETLTLSAKTTLDSGTTITATCSSNNYSEQAQAVNGKISWNLERAFPANVTAGKEYTVTFSSQGYNSVEKTIKYFTNIKYKINCEKEIVIYTDAIDSFNLPEITVLNYAESDVVIVAGIRAQGANLTLNQFIETVEEALKDPPASDSDFSKGISAIYRYTIYPKNTGSSEYESSLVVSEDVTITFKYQKQVNSVKVEHSDELLEAICFEEATVPESEFDTAGGKVRYQWQSSSSSKTGWTDIEGATAKTYAITKESLGKYFRVKVIQTWTEENGNSHDLEAVYSAPTSKLLNYVNVSMTSLIYDGLVLKGETLNPAQISGTVVDIYGNEIAASDFIVKAKDTGAINASGEYVFTLSKNTYEDAEIPVFVTVQKKITADDLPVLSERTNEIPEGYIRFEAVDYDLEYARYNKSGWGPIDDGDIPAWEGLVLYFRYPAQGTPNTAGYIKESEALSLTVTNSNIGRYVEPVVPKVMKLTDVDFDLFELALSAKANLPDGTVIKATCDSNGFAVDAQVNDGVIRWDLEQAFPENVLAGKEYKVTLAADGYDPIEESVWYFADVNYSINCDEQIVLFTDAIDSFELPEIKLLNYAPEDVDVVTNLRSAGANITLEQFKEEVKEKLANPPEEESDFNAGISLKFSYSITPKNIELDAMRNVLTVSEEIDITFKYQVLVSSVGIDRSDEYLNALCFAGEIASDSDTENAGGKVSYQWQSSTNGSVNSSNIEEGWTDIEGATAKSYQIDSNSFGKYLRVKVVQEWLEQNGTYSTLDPVYSEPTAKITNYVNTTMTSLVYDGIVLKGDKVDPSKLKGEIYDIYGKVLQPSDFEIKAKFDEALSGSSKCVFTLSRRNFTDAEVTVFVTVQYKITEADLPGFDENASYISAGKIRFAILDFDMEYAKHYPSNWKQVTDDEVTAYDGLVIYFRHAALGTPNTSGYIKESEALSMTVTNEVVGTRTTGSGLIESIENTKLELSKVTNPSGQTLIIPIIRNEPVFEGSYTFDYMIDDTYYSDPIFFEKGIWLETKGYRLHIPKGALKDDVYQITCIARVVVNGQTVKILSAVYSLKVN